MFTLEQFPVPEDNSQRCTPNTVTSANVALVINTLTLTSVADTRVSHGKHGEFVFILMQYNYILHHDEDEQIDKGSHITHRTSREGRCQFLIRGTASGG